MYDTVSVVLSPIPPDLPRSRAWEQVHIEDNPRTGERRTKRILNTHRGLHLTLADDARLIAERSLPKALRGENLHDLEPDELPAAVRAVDAEIAEMLRTELPSVAAWQPVRGDYCRNLHRGSEEAVRHELARLAYVDLPYKGRPIRGQAGGVAWPKGYLRPKAYSKHQESGQDEARGILRFEVGVFKLRGFRRALGVRPGTSLTLADVLTPAVHARVLGEYEDRLWRSPLSQQELQDEEYMRRFFARFGPRRGMQLAGFSLFWLFSGRQSLQDVVKNPKGWGLSQATVYRYIADMAAWRAEVADLEGRALAPIEGLDRVRDELARLAELAPRGGPAPRPAA